MLLINHDAGHMLKFVVTVGQLCKRLLQKHKTVPFTRVNVAALVSTLIERLGHHDSNFPFDPLMLCTKENHEGIKSFLCRIVVIH